jgi:hypothetical protein
MPGLPFKAFVANHNYIAVHGIVACACYPKVGKHAKRTSWTELYCRTNLNFKVSFNFYGWES